MTMTLTLEKGKRRLYIMCTAINSITRGIFKKQHDHYIKLFAGWEERYGWRFLLGVRKSYLAPVVDNV